MTGPEHYQEAERDIDRANNESVADGFAQFYITRAQVHATLALASATASTKFPAAYVPSPEPVDLEAWRAVL
jgi:hypothetical protein